MSRPAHSVFKTCAVARLHSPPRLGGRHIGQEDARQKEVISYDFG